MPGAEAERPSENPLILRPFFGREPALPPGPRRILLLVAFGMFFENYDIGLTNAALPEIAEELDIAAGDTAFYLSLIRLGGVGAFLLLPLADRLGRRRVFLASLIGMSIGTLASGLSQTAEQFAIAQFFTRVAMLTATALSVVIVVEEFPAEHRGAGLGMLALLGGLGFGICAGLYAAVDYLPYGWRALYAFGLAPLIALPFLRRALPETRRFALHARDARPEDRPKLLQIWLGPMGEMIRAHPRRTIAVGMAGFFGAIGAIGVFQYTNYFAQNVHGWAPAQYTLLVIGGGAIGVLGNFLGGRGSDRFGRRRIGSAVMLLAPFAAAGFFFGPSWSLAITWGIFILCTSSFDVVIRALSAELFPTSQRGTSTGWMMLVQTLGWTFGLFAIGLATETIDDLAPTITAISILLFGAAIAVLAVPETNRRELESITAGEAA